MSQPSKPKVIGKFASTVGVAPTKEEIERRMAEHSKWLEGLFVLILSNDAAEVARLEAKFGMRQMEAVDDFIMNTDWGAAVPTWAYWMLDTRRGATSCWSGALPKDRTLQIVYGLGMAFGPYRESLVNIRALSAWQGYIESCASPGAARRADFYSSVVGGASSARAAGGADRLPWRCLLLDRKAQLAHH